VQLVILVANPQLSPHALVFTVLSAVISVIFAISGILQHFDASTARGVSSEQAADTDFLRIAAKGSFRSYSKKVDPATLVVSTTEELEDFMLKDFINHKSDTQNCLDVAKSMISKEEAAYIRLHNQMAQIKQVEEDRGAKFTPPEDMTVKEEAWYGFYEISKRQQENAVIHQERQELRGRISRRETHSCGPTWTRERKKNTIVYVLQLAISVLDIGFFVTLSCYATYYQQGRVMYLWLNAVAWVLYLSAAIFASNRSESEFVRNVVTAMKMGEHRTIMQRLNAWSTGDVRNPLHLEPDEAEDEPVDRSPERAASITSGSIHYLSKRGSRRKNWVSRCVLVFMSTHC
jgi:hypothetical protein